MSYPVPAYFGESGELSAMARRADEPADLTYRYGGTVDYLATGATTGGGLGLYRWNFGTTRSGPDPHFHRTISEYFFILSGTVKLFEGNEWVDANPGDFFNVPPGGIHGFRNESGETASMLLMFTPGAPREEYFETLKALGEGLTMTDEERDAFHLAHDTYWLPA
jgi:mannose-6-phosphate isomerase-like protein (cupin superfamily)